MPQPVRVSVMPLPERSPPGRDSFDISSANVRAWAESLPLANLGQSARQVFDALTETNRLDLDPNKRFRFLETLRDPVRHVSESLERRYAGESFPLPAHLSRVAALNREFQEAMAVGYKIVAQDLLDRPQPAYVRLFQGAPICPALHRALRYMGLVLLRCYQVYAPYPENTWREIHHLYQTSLDIECTDRSVPDNEYRLIRQATTEDAYKQILLFSLASPYRLQPGESLTVYTALESWTGRCRLSAVSGQNASPQGLFAIQPDSDQQPNYLELKGGHIGHTAWVLDTTDLAQFLREQLARLRDGGHRARDLLPEMSDDLLQRLMRGWGMMTERGFERRPGEGEAEVVPGLTSAHRVLASQQGVATEPEPEGDQERGLAPGAEGLELTLDSDSSAQWAGSPMGSGPRPGIHRCGILDESQGGYRLAWRGNNRVKMKIGNLIAVRTADGEDPSSPWALGVIRWMRSETGEVLEFGVQLLARAADPVVMKPCGEGQRCSDAVPGFRLPAEGHLGRPPTLLVPGFLEHFDSPRVRITTDGEEKVLQLTHLVEGTGVFALFEYRETGPAGREASEAEGSGSALDDVWEAL